MKKHVRSPLTRLNEIRTITIRGREYDLLQEVRIDPEDLSREYRYHPEKVAFWERVHAREKAKLIRLEDALDELKWTMFQRYWDAMKYKGKDFSDSFVWSHVYQNDAIVSRRKEVREQKIIVESVWCVCKALEHRKSALISLGAQMRRDDAPLAINKERRT